MLSKHSCLLEDGSYAKECHFANDDENPEFINDIGGPIYFCSDFANLAVIHRVPISSAFKCDVNRDVTSGHRLK
jgi:hypothetical protein